jgi:general secretion pathway protein D
VESLIAEVNADKAAEFGIQWQSLPWAATATTSWACWAPTSASAAPTSSTLATAAGQDGNVVPSAGFNARRGAQDTTACTCWASWPISCKPTGDGNILSTPNLLTLDNEEAKIVIGQNVPFVTGQYTNNNSGSSGSVNPFRPSSARTWA